MSSHDNSSVEQTTQPKLCTKCNSFFANAACNDYCSKCYREQEASNAKSIAPPASEAASRTAEPATFTPAQASSSSAPEVAAPEKSKANRCDACRKKVGLCGFKCKCGQVFCGQHRYAESHGCQFDYKSSERAKLMDANPVVQAMKVQKL